MFFDFHYILFMAPWLLLAFLASMITKSTFSRYSRIGSRSGYTGAEAAAEMLRRSGIRDYRIERVGGHLTDHYDPRSRTLRLSSDVYGSTSLSAIGVACHEAGHAIQHAHSYAFLGFRSTLVPATNFCSQFYIFPVIGGLFLGSSGLFTIGLAMLAMTVVFAVVTLPVEWDASRRAKMAMIESRLLSQEETVAAGRVLNAAFLTYLASAVVSLMTLAYWMLRARSGDD